MIIILHHILQLWADKKNSSYDGLRLQIKEWYNGYRFGEDVIAVYNPFSVINALDKQECENFWLQTGTPSFLIQEMEKIIARVELEHASFGTILCNCRIS